MQVLDEERIPRVDLFFLQDPNDHLRLSLFNLAILVQIFSCYFWLRSKTDRILIYGGSEAGWMWARNAYQYSRAWAHKLTPSMNTY